MTPNIKNIIKDIALSIVGIEEIGNNEGFTSKFLVEYGMEFSEMLRTVGWKPPQAYCAYTAEAVWKMAYSKHDSLIVKELDTLFSANSMQTLENFKQSRFKVSKYGCIGALAIYSHYKNGRPTSKGHTDIVIEPGEVFKIVGGNILGKNGKDIVGQKTRIKNFDNKKGMVLQAFIHPIEIL